MTKLRVLLRAPPDPAIAVPWALFDEAGRMTARGVASPQQWPRADAREAVLAGEAVRNVALQLPPMPPARRAAAALYALEDQLAGPPEAHLIALDPPAAGAATLARIASRPLVEQLSQCEPPFARIVAETDLAEPSDGWRWCGGVDGGFVRRQDGSTFLVGSMGAEGALPLEMAMALAQAEHAGTLPSTIDVQAPCDAAACDRWGQRHGLTFRARAPWQWDASARIDEAPDLRLALAERPAPVPAARMARLFAAPLALAAIALVLHVGATAGTWAARRIELAHNERALAEVAAQSGVRDAGNDSPGKALAREHGKRLHQAGKLGPGDALPLLARAAPHVAQLPDGALKSATYASGAWTLELAPLDDEVVSRLVQQIAAQDVPVAQARSAGGVRVRVGPLP